MERLTYKTENGWVGVRDLEDKNVSPTSVAIHKLAEFEDFMEQEEFTSLEDLKAYIKLQSKGSNDLMQENQALKDRWQKLKEFTKIEHDWGLDENYQDHSYAMKLVFDRMEELEKE